VVGLTVPKIETVRVGFIGLGMRGPGAVSRFTHIPGVEIVALCDLYADRVEKTQVILDNAGLPRAESIVEVKRRGKSSASAMILTWSTW